MTREELKAVWKAEEDVAHINGWDFSHIHGRYEEEESYPWDYGQIIRSYLTDDRKLLDYDTGGGEFLLSLGHPFANTSATEGYPPNVRLCRKMVMVSTQVDEEAQHFYRKLGYKDAGGFVVDIPGY